MMPAGYSDHVVCAAECIYVVQKATRLREKHNLSKTSCAHGAVVSNAVRRLSPGDHPPATKGRILLAFKPGPKTSSAAVMVIATWYLS